MSLVSRMLRATVWPAIAVLTTAVGGVLLAPASPAAASCSHGYSDRDNHNPTYIQVTGSNVAMRQGPHSSCGLIDRFSSGTNMYPWCWVYGDSVTRNGTTYNTWSRVHLGAVGDPEGWMSDAYLNNGGADNPC